MNLALKKSSVASYGIVIAACGVTLTSVAGYRAQGIEYYACIGIGGLLCLPFFIFNKNLHEKSFFFALLLILFPILIFVSQALLFSINRAYDTSLTPILGISYVFFLCATVNFLDENTFRRAMFFTAVIHLFICIYGIAKWDFQTADLSDYRFQSLDVHIAVWGEIALGTLIASILSKNRPLILFSLIVFTVIVKATEMRGAAVSGFAMIFFILMILVKRRGNIPFITTVMLGIFAFLFFFDTIISSLRSALLLDDFHRGLGSGFSGRLDNVRDGLNKFLESPIVGAGPLDFTASFVHNGYLKIFAQYGLFFGLPMIWLLLVLLRRAFKDSSLEITAAVLAYALFLMSSPRYINLQIMPLVGLFALARIITHAKEQFPPGKTYRSRGEPCV